MKKSFNIQELFAWQVQMPQNQANAPLPPLELSKKTENTIWSIPVWWISLVQNKTNKLPCFIDRLGHILWELSWMEWKDFFFNYVYFLQFSIQFVLNFTSEKFLNDRRKCIVGLQEFSSQCIFFKVIMHHNWFYFLWQIWMW